MEQKSDVRIKVENVSKSFANKSSANSSVNKVVDHISFNVYNNEFLVLLGPGRCGKTVLLDMICGLIPQDSGSIIVNDKEVTGPDPEIGRVFQKLGLWPWLTVMENVEFGPMMRGISKSSRRQTAAHFIELVGLKGFENHYPYQLSGGMKQRVGIARAYANGAQILIMDEPFGQLDAQTRYEMQHEIVNISKQEKRTIIFVTNNIEEAVKISDRIILLTKAPASIKEIFEVELKKPRDEMSQRFLEIREHLSNNTDLAL